MKGGFFFSERWGKGWLDNDNDDDDDSSIVLKKEFYTVF